MFIEGERAVPNGLLSERAQELDSVVSRYLPTFYKRAFRFLGNIPDAEDAVQDALLSAYKDLGQFRGASSTFNLVNNNRHQRCADEITPPR